MSSIGLFGDIKNAVNLYFNFLLNYGFEPFREEQRAYEYHFNTCNQWTKIDIWYEMSISTPIWVKIGGFYVELIEPANPLFTELSQQRELLYSSNRSSEDLSHSEICERYKLFGKDWNDRYLQAAANLLQHNEQILAGDLSILIANRKQQQIEIVVEDAKRRERERIYIAILKLMRYLIHLDSIQSSKLSVPH